MCSKTSKAASCIAVSQTYEANFAMDFVFVCADTISADGGNFRKANGQSAVAVS